jgi:uncharacterized protein (DUF362 family)
MNKRPSEIDGVAGLPRRQFLKQSALAAAGLAVGAPLLQAGIRRLGPALRTVPAAAAKSKVVWIHSSKVIDAAGRVEAPLLQEMLDKALTEFTGRGSIADAWRQFVKPEDIVGLKLNTLGLSSIRGMDYVQHFPAMVAALSSGLQKAGIKEKNLVVWDRSGEEMKDAGFILQSDPGSIRYMANKNGMRDREGNYNPDRHPVGSKSSRLSAIWTDVCTAVINVPVPKTHGQAAFTNALKMHYGTIDNAFEFHANGCTKPGIAEVNAIPIIRQKQKLVVSDALLMAIEAGPRWDRRFIRPAGGLLVGTDPVAVDAAALMLLDEKRAADGMEAIAPRVAHIALAEELGLGNARLENIDLVKIDLG